MLLIKPREVALKRVVKNKDSDILVFVVRYHPALPSVSQINLKHWRTMTLDPEMKETFPKPPLIAYTRPQSIRQKLIRAKLPPRKPRRIVNGMFKCKIATSRLQNMSICENLQVHQRSTHRKNNPYSKTS